MNKVINKISKYCFWTKAYKNRQKAKAKIRILGWLDYNVVLKQWEHRSWGDMINIDADMKVSGHISGVRPLSNGYTAPYCDLMNGDILIYEIAESQRHLVNGDIYAVGYLEGIDKCSNPRDLFFADFKALFTASDVSDIKKLVKKEIKRLEQYL